jgi:hypothetical protein
LVGKLLYCMLKMLAITCELVNLSCRCHIQAITINIPLSTINIGFFKFKCLLLKSETNTETERNFRILLIYYFFWHKKCLGRW